jgi:hypothetical protein
MSPWDECICGHTLAEHDTDDGGCAVSFCPCPWFDRDTDCLQCGVLAYGCEHAAVRDFDEGRGETAG